MKKLLAVMAIFSLICVGCSTPASSGGTTVKETKTDSKGETKTEKVTKPVDTKPTEVAPPEIKAPDIKVPDVKVPEIKAPEIKAPEIKAPEVKLPEGK